MSRTYASENKTTTQPASVQRVVPNVFNSVPVQAKLILGQPDDPYEREANTVADRVMTMRVPQIPNHNTKGNVQAKTQPQGVYTISLKAERGKPEEEKEEKVQTRPLHSYSIFRKETGVGTDAHAINSIECNLHSSQGGGSPMSNESRQFMESRFDADFSNVRIHTGSTAVQMSNQLSAQAFTYGNNIYFNEGKYQPDTSEGKHLLAHELTHTIQQGAVVRSKQKVSSVAEPRVQRSILDWVKEKIAPIADNIPGFTLICYIIGRNPITGKDVERNPINFIRALLGLIPGGTALFDELNKSGAITNAYNWVVSQLAELNISWAVIKELFAKTWDEMSIWNGIGGNIDIIKKNFGPFVQRLLTFGKRAWSKIKEFVFRGFLSLVGAPVEKIMSIINKVGALISTIFENPGRFISNLLNAVGLGLKQFGKNILTHLKNGITGWLFGAIGDLNIKLPEKFNIAGVFSIVAQILGLTYQNIRAKIVKRIGPRGEQIISAIESTIEFIKDFITRGPIALWEKVKEWLGNLYDTVMGAVIDWVRNTIIVQGLARLATMFNPIGAIIELIRGLYTTIMFLIERAKQIAAFVESVFDSMSAIAAGRIANAANAIENALGKTLTLAISFLASYMGLGGIAAKIKGIIEKIRQPIDKAIDKVVDWVVTKAEGLVQVGKGAIQSVTQWWKSKIQFQSASGEAHSIFLDGSEDAPELMIASNKKSYANFIKQIKTNNDKQEAAKVKAMAIAKKIDEAIKSRKRSETIDGTKDQSKDFTSLLNQLAEETKIFMERDDGELPVSTQPVYGPLTKAGFATKMTVEKLTRLGPAGTRPSVSNPIWETLNRRRSGNGSYYILGHLLNQNLHGSGSTWQNLTPLSRSGNAQHEVQVESKIKERVLNKDKSIVVRYEVEPIYSRSRDESFIKKLNATAKPVAEAEEFVPDALRCEAKVLSPADESFSLNVTVKNEIGKNPADYSVVGS